MIEGLQQTGVEVRIRHADAAEGATLCEVEFDKLDQLVVQIKRWGLVMPDGNITDKAFGQFVLADEAYFEVIVGADDE